MPSPPGLPTSDIRPRTQEEPNIPPSLLALLIPVYSEVLIPRGLIGRPGVVLGCRALPLLHDEHGHPLFVMTHRGNQHLTVGVLVQTPLSSSKETTEQWSEKC